MILILCPVTPDSRKADGNGSRLNFQLPQQACSIFSEQTDIEAPLSIKNSTSLFAMVPLILGRRLPFVVCCGELTIPMEIVAKHI